MEQGQGQGHAPILRQNLVETTVFGKILKILNAACLTAQVSIFVSPHFKGQIKTNLKVNIFKPGLSPNIKGLPLVLNTQLLSN